MKSGHVLRITMTMIAAYSIAARAQENVGTAFTYQGILKDDGSNVEDTADFVFTQWDAAENGSQVGTPVFVNSVEVVDGLFSVELDFGATPYGADEARWLEIQVRSPAGQGEFETLSPRQRITPTPYSLATRGIHVDDADFVSIGRTNRIGSEFFGIRAPVDGYGGMYMETEGDLGKPFYGYAMAGSIAAWHYFDGPSNQWRLWAGVERLVVDRATGNVGIASLTPEARLHVRSGDTTPTLLSEQFGTGPAAQFVRDSTSVGSTIMVSCNSAAGSGIFSTASNASTALNAISLGSGNAVTAQALGASSGNAGYFRVASPTNDDAALFCKTEGTGVSLHADGVNDASLNDDGIVMIGDSGSLNMVLDRDEIIARSNGVASTLFLNNLGGNVVIGGASNGTSILSTPVLEIRGGADLSEMFDVQGEVRPGMLVVIDPNAPGRLIPSTRAYDRKVAGIISGAGGVATGMTMGHVGTIADGEHPVALSGRVYCLADASGQAIEPGDLLTTSATRGHAMKATSHTRFMGAVIGKAMTALPKGERGLVLVLVSLQ